MFHLITNDLKSMGVDACVNSMYDLIETTTKLHQTEVIISLPPPSQRIPHNEMITEVKNILREDFSLNVIDHTDSFMYRGRIDRSLYKDSTHPNPKGLGRIVSTIKLIN